MKPKKTSSANILRPIPIPDDSENFATDFNEKDIAERAVVSNILVDEEPKFFLSISSTSHLGCIQQTTGKIPVPSKNPNCAEEAAGTTISGEKTKSEREYTESFEICAADNFRK